MVDQSPTHVQVGVGLEATAAKGVELLCQCRHPARSAHRVVGHDRRAAVRLHDRVAAGASEGHVLLAGEQLGVAMVCESQSPPNRKLTHRA